MSTTQFANLVKSSLKFFKSVIHIVYFQLQDEIGRKLRIVLLILLETTFDFFCTIIAQLTLGLYLSKGLFGAGFIFWAGFFYRKEFYV